MTATIGVTMWCPQCQHEAPCLPGLPDQPAYCGRCGEALSPVAPVDEPDAAAARDRASAAEFERDEPPWGPLEGGPLAPEAAAPGRLPETRLEDPYWEGWRLEQDLDTVEEMLESWRIDESHQGGSRWEAPPQEEVRRGESRSWPSPPPGGLLREANPRWTEESPFSRGAWGLLLTGLGAGLTALLLAAAAWLTGRDAPWAQILVCGCFSQALVLIGLLACLHSAQQRSTRVDRNLAEMERSLRWLMQQSRAPEIRTAPRQPRR